MLARTWARARRWWAARYTRNFKQQQRNDLVVVDDWHNVLMGCCDCGLYHRFDFDVSPSGRLTIRGRRDFIATAAARRAKEFPFQPQRATQAMIEDELYKNRP